MVGNLKPEYKISETYGWRAT